MSLAQAQGNPASRQRRTIPTGRWRRMPLVPEPFNNVSEGLLVDYDPQEPRACSFSPILSLQEYSTAHSSEAVVRIFERSAKLVKHNQQNLAEGVSESSWEMDTRGDVFDRIREDSRLRIDKRSYEYKSREADEEEPTLKWRTPDATFGLGSYSKEQLQTDGSGSPLAHQTLSTDRISDQLQSTRGGLVVDPRWASSNLLFPWAVYEAKKESSDFKQAEDQIYHAASVYLAMLDDLARDPKDPKKYQYGDSQNYQIFGFTSCGSRWKVYQIYCCTGTCTSEIIWEGDVCDTLDATTLLCLVDQIQAFAVSQHRDFVIKHLETWLKHYEESTPNYESDDLVVFEYPEWSRFRDDSRRQRKLRKREARRNQTTSELRGEATAATP